MENIKYNIEFIYLFKDLKDEEYEEQIFNEIRNSLKLENLKKVKYDKKIDLYDNKWYRKKYHSEIEKFEKKIVGLLNKYSSSNYKDITEKILKIKVKNKELINLIVNKIINKYISENKNDKLNYLIKKLIYSNNDKWKFDDTYHIIIMIDTLQNYYNEIKENVHFKMLDLIKNNIDEFYFLKNYNIGIIKLISEYFNLNLISKEIIINILNELTNNKDEYYKLELGIHLIKFICNFIDDLEKKKFINYLDNLYNYDNLNIKIKFLILDIIEKNNDLCKETSNYDINDNNQNLILNNINEYKNIRDINYFFENIISINYYLYHIIIFNIDDNEIYKIIENLLDKKLIEKIDILNNLKLIKNNINDLKLDYPNINDFISSFEIKLNLNN